MVATDVFVVGGGPAGLAAAIAARQRGLDVILADAARPPIDKACGEGLMPNGVVALRNLGVTLPSRHAVPFLGIRFIAPGRSAAAWFRDEPGQGVRRTTLHHLLVERAAALGVRFAWGARVRGITAEGVVLDEDRVACRWLVGADGERSLVRREAGLTAAASRLPRVGFRRHVKVAPWTDVVEVYWCDGAQVFVTPIGPTGVCIALISRDPRLRFDRLPEICPELGRRLDTAPATTPERGALTVSRRLRAVSRGRTALIGEASGSVDAVTGEGLSLTFEQALALGDALAAGDLTRYETAHRLIRRMPAFMAGLLLAMDRSPRLRVRALRAFSAEDSLFSRLLALRVSTPASPTPAARTLCELGWRLLTA